MALCDVEQLRSSYPAHGNVSTREVLTSLVLTLSWAGYAPPVYTSTTYPGQTMTQCPNPLPTNVLDSHDVAGSGPEQVINLTLHT